MKAGGIDRVPFLLIWSISLRTFENADLEAVTLADRIVLLRGGTIGQQGSPLELFKGSPRPLPPGSSARHP